MNVLRLNHSFNVPSVRTGVSPRVYVGGRRRYALAVSRWTVQPLPTGPTLELRVHPGVSGRYVSSARDLPAVGAEVGVEWPGDEGCRFAGVVVAHRHHIGDDGEMIVAEVASVLYEALGQPVIGRWQVSEGGATFLYSGEVNFNADAMSLASMAAVAVGSRAAPVFETHDGAARRWSVAGALAYLLAVGVPSDIECPSYGALCRMAGDVDLGSYSPGETPLGRVLAEVAARAGLAVRFSEDGRGLVAYEPGAHGRRRRVGLQLTGERFDPNQSDVWRVDVTLRPRPSRPGVLAIGDVKQYEATFALEPGWDPAIATDRWRDVVRGFADDWSASGDVYRKWVLNEHGQCPWVAESYDFCEIDATDFPLAIARRFEPCLSTNASGQSLGVVIEYSIDGGEWRRWPGPAWVAQEECAVYLGGESLPADYFQAATDGAVSVRVTATVAADVRLYIVEPGDHGLPRKIVRATGLTQRVIHPGSAVQQSAASESGGIQDDTPLLRSLACQANIAAGEGADAEITLPWIDPGSQVGDRVDRIEGRALELATQPGAVPHIAAVHHDLLGQTTQLEVRG